MSHNSILNLPSIIRESLAEIIGADALSLSSHSQGVNELISEDESEKIIQLKVLKDQFGINAAEGFARLAGRSGFHILLRNASEEMGFSCLEFRLKPMRLRLQEGLQKCMNWLSENSGNLILFKQSENNWQWMSRVMTYPERLEEFQVFFQFIAGFLQEFLNWCTGSKYYRVRKIGCQNEGAEQCIFQLDMNPLE